jgi:hypothetical protein
MDQEEDKLHGRLHGDQPEVQKDGLGMRFVYMLLIWFMISLAQTVLTVVTVIQFVLMLLNSGTPNDRLADFGTDLGVWIAKAARFQTGASEVKPWPWTELD